MSDTLTLGLNGEVPLSLFTQALEHLQGLIAHIEKEIQPAAEITWMVADLSANYAQATIRGDSPDADAVASVAAAYLAIGRALAAGNPVPYSEGTVEAARALTRLINGTVPSVRFETAEDDATIARSSDPDNPDTHIQAWGAVEGRIQPFSSRTPLRFMLFDTLYDRPVSCYLQPGHDERLRQVWDRRAMVEGWVSRDATTGRPVTVRRIQDITLLDDIVPGSIIRSLESVAPLAPGAPSAVDVIRAIRDE